AFPLAFVGGTVGSRLLLEVSNEALRPVVLVMLIAAAVVLAVRRPTGTESSERRPTVAVLVALAIGTYDGFFGPGTGTFLIVCFVTWCGRTLVDASADAKVINVGSNLGALVTFILADRVAWAVALPMAVAQLCGGMLGARFAMAGGARVVRIVVLLVSGALVVKLGYDLL
ncbi:MAG TPA: TSUP family transporter, partial [Kofleriaceae bacterium]|nr:TSUP family transporter [Kofleriaceae bacterium]